MIKDIKKLIIMRMLRVSNNGFNVCNLKNDDAIFGNKTRHALKIEQAVTIVDRTPSSIYSLFLHQYAYVRDKIQTKQHFHHSSESK